MNSLPRSLLKDSIYKEDPSVGFVLSSFFDGDLNASCRATAKMALVWLEPAKDSWRCSTFKKTYEAGWTSTAVASNDTHFSTGDVVVKNKGTVTLRDFEKATSDNSCPLWAKQWKSMGVPCFIQDPYTFDVRNCLPVQTFMFDVLFNSESAFSSPQGAPKHVILCVNSNAPLSASCRKILHDLLYVKSSIRTRFLRKAFNNKDIPEDTILQVIVKAPHHHYLNVSVQTTPLRIDKPLPYLLFLSESFEASESEDTVITNNTNNIVKPTINTNDNIKPTVKDDSNIIIDNKPVIWGNDDIINTDNQPTQDLDDDSEDEEDPNIDSGDNKIVDNGADKVVTPENTDPVINNGKNVTFDIPEVKDVNGTDQQFIVKDNDTYIEREVQGIPVVQSKMKFRRW